MMMISAYRHQIRILVLVLATYLGIAIAGPLSAQTSVTSEDEFLQRRGELIDRIGESISAEEWTTQVALYKELLALTEGWRGQDHPDTVQVREALTLAMVMTGESPPGPKGQVDGLIETAVELLNSDPERSVVLLNEALALARETLPDDDYRIDSITNWLQMAEDSISFNKEMAATEAMLDLLMTASQAEAERDYDKAIAIYEEALALAEKNGDAVQAESVRLSIDLARSMQELFQELDPSDDAPDGSLLIDDVGPGEELGSSGSDKGRVYDLLTETWTSLGERDFSKAEETAQAALDLASTPQPGDRKLIRKAEEALASARQHWLQDLLGKFSFSTQGSEAIERADLDAAQRLFAFVGGSREEEATLLLAEARELSYRGAFDAAVAAYVEAFEHRLSVAPAAQASTPPAAAEVHHEADPTHFNRDAPLMKVMAAVDSLPVDRAKASELIAEALLLLDPALLDESQLADRDNAQSKLSAENLEVSAERRKALIEKAVFSGLNEADRSGIEAAYRALTARDGTPLQRIEAAERVLADNNVDLVDLSEALVRTRNLLESNDESSRGWFSISMLELVIAERTLVARSLIDMVDDELGLAADEQFRSDRTYVDQSVARQVHMATLTPGEDATPEDIETRRAILADAIERLGENDVEVTELRASLSGDLLEALGTAYRLALLQAKAPDLDTLLAVFDAGTALTGDQDFHWFESTYEILAGLYKDRLVEAGIQAHSQMASGRPGEAVDALAAAARDADVVLEAGSEEKLAFDAWIKAMEVAGIPLPPRVDAPPASLLRVSAMLREFQDELAAYDGPDFNFGDEPADTRSEVLSFFIDDIRARREAVRRMGKVAANDAGRLFDQDIGAFVEAGLWAEAVELRLAAVEYYDRNAAEDAVERGYRRVAAAVLLRELGRVAEAYELTAEAIGILEKANQTDTPAYHFALQVQTDTFLAQGRPDLATPIYQRIVQLAKSATNEAVDWSNAAYRLSEVMVEIDAPERAAPVLLDLIGAQVDTSDSFADELYFVTSNPLEASFIKLGYVHLSAGQAREAEAALRFADLLSALTKTELARSSTRQPLAHLFAATGRSEQAISIHRDLLAARAADLGFPDLWLPSLPDHLALAELLVAQQSGEAVQHARKAIEIVEHFYGGDHPGAARVLLVAAKTARAADDEALARHWLSRGLDAARDVASGLLLDKFPPDDLFVSGPEPSALLDAYLELLAADYEADAAGAFASAFSAAQLSGPAQAASAIAQMAARAGAGDPAVTALVRQFQELQAEHATLIELIARERAADPGGTAGSSLAAKRKDVVGQLGVLRGTIANTAPELAEAIGLQRFGADDAQKQLAADEALVLAYAAEATTHMFVVTAEEMLWHRSPLGRDALSEMVSKLREGLDPTLGTKGSLEAGGSDDGASDFDLSLAYDLYSKVLEPVAAELATKTHILFVPTGPLQSLPLHVLVTEPPAAGLERGEAWRSAAWLMRRHAISTIPSVSSLEALRRPAGVAGKQPFFGLGNPNFARVGGGTTKQVAGLELKGVARFFRNGQADRQSLAMLTPLPDTETEIEALKTILGGRSEDILLGDEATETALMARDLSGFAVLAFSTHGLVAGDLVGLSEPALAVTPDPAAGGSAHGDGLLTASEIVRLKLDADWVILSACNTASSDGSPGAEGLSGLARAFFFAGARALLVSHWPVYSRAATALTTATVAAFDRSPNARRAEALREAMVELADEGDFFTSSPAYWAPFVIVGRD